MKTEDLEKSPFTDEQADFVLDLLHKATNVNEATNKYSNCSVTFKEYGMIGTPMRVDDIQLLYIGSRLIPNVFNYLFNVIPQLIYPYVMAYLQDLSSLGDESTITVNDLFNLIKNFDNPD